MRTINEQRALTEADRDGIHRAIAALIPAHGPEFLARPPMLLTDERFDSVDFDSVDSPVQLFAALLEGVELGVAKIEFIAEEHEGRFSGYAFREGSVAIGVSTLTLGEDIPGWVADAALLIATLRGEVELARKPTDAEILAYGLLCGFGALLLSGATRIRKSGDRFHTLTTQSISGPWETSTWAYALAAQLSLRESGSTSFTKIRDTTPSREACRLFNDAWGRPSRMALVAYFEGVPGEWEPPAPDLELVGVDEEALQAAMMLRNAGALAMGYRPSSLGGFAASVVAGLAAGVVLTALLTPVLPGMPFIALPLLGAAAGTGLFRRFSNPNWRCNECISELPEGAETCGGCGATIHAFVRTRDEAQAARLAILDHPVHVPRVPPQNSDTHRVEVTDTPYASVEAPRPRS